MLPQGAKVWIVDVKLACVVLHHAEWNFGVVKQLKILWILQEDSDLQCIIKPSIKLLTSWFCVLFVRHLD